jgi:hypothetical protein
MEERVKTSFIPKTSLETPGFKRPHGDPAALANIVAGALLVLAIAGAGGVYFFQQYTQSSITSKQDSLARSREAFEPDTIKQLAKLDTRIETGKTLLSTHVAVSDLFDELEKLTLSSVRYTNFDYSVVAPGHVVLTMSGQAASYNAVALQSDAFSKSAVITDPIFSNVNVDKNGYITFDFTAVIDTSHMLYAPGNASASASAPASPATPASGNATTTGL